MKSLFFNGKPGKHHLNDSHWDVNVRSEVQDGVNGLWTEKEMTVEAVIEEDERTMLLPAELCHVRKNPTVV